MYVLVDPRIELMSVVQMLSGYPLTTRHNFSYKQSVQDHFSIFKNHPAVLRFSDISRRSFNFDAPPKTMLALGDPPGLEPRMPYPEDVVLRAEGRRNLDQFAAALKDFAESSGFLEFFKTHEHTCQQLAGDFALSSREAVKRVSSYAGLDLSQVTVVLGLLLHRGGFAARLEPTPGKSEGYALLGPAGSRGQLPIFGSPQEIAEITMHEIGHLFVNSLTEKHSEEVERYARLYKTIVKPMKNRAYPDWQTAVNEHVIRAITTRITFIMEGPKAGSEALHRERGKGFIYLDVLLNRLREYEVERERYPRFADFYPRLLEGFAEVSSG
jgi:hypothetical protein